MKHSQKITAKKYSLYLLSFAFCILLSACGITEKEDAVQEPISQKAMENSPLLSQISQARKGEEKKEKSVSLVLEASETNGDEATVKILVRNPKEKPLHSVRSFLSFPTEILEGSKIVLSPESPFSIAAPGEQNFDEKNGLVKIGVSTAEGKTVTAQEIHIADVVFRQKTKSSALLDFYRSAAQNETIVFQKMDDGSFQNILLEPKSPALLLFSE